MYRDRAPKYPTVATPRYPTRQLRHVGDEEVLSSLHKFKHMGAKRCPVPFTTRCPHHTTTSARRPKRILRCGRRCACFVRNPSLRVPNRATGSTDSASRAMKGHRTS